MLLRRARFREPNPATTAFIATVSLLLTALLPSANMASSPDAHRSYAGGGYEDHGGYGSYAGHGGYGGQGGYGANGGYEGGGYGKSGNSLSTHLEVAQY